jgi:hypothetical protein
MTSDRPDRTTGGTGAPVREGATEQQDPGQRLDRDFMKTLKSDSRGLVTGAQPSLILR